MGDAGGASLTLIIFLVVLAALGFEFKSQIAQKAVEFFPGGSEDLRGIVWANSVARVGGSTGAVCCYSSEWKVLNGIFCDEDIDLGVVRDAIPMLGHCSQYVKGRMEL